MKVYNSARRHFLYPTVLDFMNHLHRVKTNTIINIKTMLYNNDMYPDLTAKFSQTNHVNIGDGSEVSRYKLELPNFLQARISYNSAQVIVSDHIHIISLHLTYGTIIHTYNYIYNLFSINAINTNIIIACRTFRK